MQERALATRRKILIAAAEVFASQGYAGASMSDLLAGTGMTKGALYFHFASKEELAQAIFAEDQHYSAPHTEISPEPLQELIDMSHDFATSLQQDPIARASVRLAVEMAFNGTAAPSGFSTWAASVATLLMQAGERGHLAQEMDAVEVAEVITASFTGLQLLSEAASQRRDLHQRLTRWWQLFMVGLAASDVVTRLAPEGTRGSRMRK